MLQSARHWDISFLVPFTNSATASAPKLLYMVARARVVGGLVLAVQRWSRPMKLSDVYRG
jgi:hypothetical protein